MRIVSPDKNYEPRNSAYGWENIISGFRLIYIDAAEKYKNYIFNEESTSTVFIVGNHSYTTGLLSSINNCSNLPITLNDLEKFLPTINSSSDLTNTMAS
jgi:hypothetical protein